jgi:riboflavin biosynthesis pyrimidine reductase
VIEDDDPGYDGAHIVEVLCEDAKDAYLAWLRSAGISYIFAGSKEMDLSLALSKLRSLFNIRTLLLEGGSVLNGAFAREGLIDELSLVTAPVTADPDDLPLLSKSSIHSWNLESVSDHSGILVSKYSKQKDC